MLGTFLQDVRYGLRTLWKQPGFTAVAVVALALGIGANTTIFSAINALLLHPFNFRDVDRLAAVWEARAQDSGGHDSVAFANYLDVREQSSAFAGAAAWTGWNANLAEGDQPERIEGVATSPQLFDVLGVQPVAGRGFRAEEEQPGHDPVVVLSDGLWRRRFNADPGIVGRNVRINERSFTVVGVMPADFAYPRRNIELWTPLIADKEDLTNRGGHYLQVVARLKPGATIASAQSEMNALAARLAAQYPQTNANRSFQVETLTDSVGRGPRPYLLISLGAVLFVLLIACANVANLQLMRATTRQREIAVRLALGASRWRIIRQLLTESVLLAVGGGALGLLLSVWAIDAIAAGMPANFARFVNGWDRLGIDWRVFGFTLIISILTGVVFGLAPALLATRTNLNEALKEGGRTGATGGRGRMRAVLMIAEVALSLVLLTGAGLMVRSFMRLLDVRPGFNGQNVLTMELSLPFRKYQQDTQAADFYAQLVKRAESLPGVEAAAAVDLVPLDNSDNSAFFNIGGRAPFAPGTEPLADFRTITPGYFNALDIPMLGGRNFTERDTREMPRVALVSQKLARRYFADVNPLGQHLVLGKETYEIVGIVGDVRYKSFTDEPRDERLRPAIYVPHAQAARRNMVLVVRSATNNAAALTDVVRHEVSALDKDQPIFNVRTMPQVFVEAMAPQRLSAFMFASFALVALILAAVGIYAVVAYSVAQRTHEIGVRMALGAQGRDILRMVIRQGMLLTGAGVVAGLVASFALTRAMASILYGVSASDPVTFGGVAAMACAVALVACLVPARRATKVDPMVALRYE
jgi:putative ABC transport system permease protein